MQKKQSTRAKTETIKYDVAQKLNETWKKTFQVTQFLDFPSLSKMKQKQR